METGQTRPGRRRVRTQTASSGPGWGGAGKEAGGAGRGGGSGGEPADRPAAPRLGGSDGVRRRPGLWCGFRSSGRRFYCPFPLGLSHSLWLCVPGPRPPRTHSWEAPAVTLGSPTCLSSSRLSLGHVGLFSFLVQSFFLGVNGYFLSFFFFFLLKCS